MTAVILVGISTFVAALWSLIKYQVAYVACMGSLPPQLQDGVSSKFAFPEYVLRPSTPLMLQVEYLKSQVGFCLATGGISLLCYLLDKNIACLIVLVMFVVITALTSKSCRIYSANRIRRMSGDSEQT